MTSPPDDATANESASLSESPMAIASVFNRPEQATAKSLVFPADDPIKELPDIEKVIRAIPNRPLNSRLLEDDFILQERLDGPLIGHVQWKVKSRSRFHQYRLHLLTLMQLQDHRYDLSLHAQAFLKHLHWCWLAPYDRYNLGLIESDARHVSQQFQQSLEELTEEITSPSFKRQVKESDTAAKSRATSLRKWMRAAFRQAPYLLWVQMQLGYHARHYDDLTQTLQDRQAFLASLKKSQLFNYLVGYVGKLHYLPSKGFMHDIIFLYDARHVQEGASLEQALASRWKDVTDQHGMVWVEGDPIHPKALKINGIWTLETKEDTQTLQQLIRYLSHYDTYLNYYLPPHTRTLVKSQTPGKKRAKNAKKGGAKKDG